MANAAAPDDALDDAPRGAPERFRAIMLDRHLPLWAEHGWDRRHGGFHERLDRDLRPIDLGYKRLLVQCRQLYSFSQAVLLGERRYLPLIGDGFAWLRAHYWDAAQGGWIFKATPEGRPLDPMKDTYGHAFVLFACAYVHRATGDAEPIALAHRTLDLLEVKLAAPAGGFFEAAEADWTPRPGLRLQNPHMHLLEALVALDEAAGGAAGGLTGEARFRDGARAIGRLFLSKLFDPSTGTLGEYFDQDWKPDAARGHIVEPGHHCEWSWLLHRLAARVGDEALAVAADRLFDHALVHGWDAERGGVYDEVDRSGRIVTGRKRIWPLTEAVKAAATRWRRTGAAADRTRLEQFTAFLLSRYGLAEGRWHEHLERDLSVFNDTLPGSTTYHLLLAAVEAARGRD